MAEASVIDRTRVLLNAPLPEGYLRIARNWLTARFLGLVKVFWKGEEWQFVEHLQMQKQCYDHWCWAAVASSIAKCFNPGSNCEQCTVASKQVEITDEDCCKPKPANQPPPPYDLPKGLRDALKFVDCYNTDEEHASDKYPDVLIKERPDLKRIIAELTEGRPICVRIKWSKDPDDKGAHFLVIAGFRDKSIAVLDSEEGHYPVPYPHAQFPGKYSGLDSTWTHTYFTKSGKKNCQT